MSRTLRILVVALTSIVGCTSLWAQNPQGTLVLDVQSFTSEVELKEKIENRIKTGGLEWGVSKGQIVVSLVSKRFIRFELPNFTRYGESKSLDLEPGTYRLTCVGFVPEGGFSVEKALKKGAYFNLDILTFTVNAGQTTTLEVHPVIHKTSTFFVKFFVPELAVTVTENGVLGVERVINERTSESIAWEDYTGPLKF